jgi:hypothetical protein
VVTFRKPFSETSVNPREIKIARFAYEPASFGEHLFAFTLYQCPISLAGEVKSGKELAFLEFLVIQWLIDGYRDLLHEIGSAFDCLCDLTQSGRPLCEIAPHLFVEVVIPTEPRCPMLGVDAQEIPQDHRNSVWIPEGLIPRLQRVNGKTIQEFANKNDVLMLCR